MKTRLIETVRSRSVPAARLIIPPERSIADRDQAPGDEARAQTHFWARPGNYLWAMGGSTVVGAAVVGLGLHFYSVRETLVSLALFSLLFFSLSVVVLIAFGIRYSGKKAAIWAGPASRAVLEFFRQQDRGETELAPVLVVEDIRRPPDQRNDVQT
jgi:hypothetical protein